ncbi:uncharacterized protein LOC130716013 [Lotus japonicus]|uniref:uncharacterized protein LOC130716013 n=1 Tax=Lotus japonicus TaxID=34305 RepID=UPI0025877C6D|nr:uncharacterized protein LOC130716013 [Lotus japonicus]
MFHSHRLRFLLHLNTLCKPSPNPKISPLLHPKPSSLSIVSHNLFSTTCDKQSFTVSYFKTNCGFSHQAALKASKRVLFNDANKPDSVITFFTNHGFTLSQTHNVIGRTPELLLFDPTTKLLPKFQFLASKGASPSDIVTTVIRSPRFLRKNLEKQIVPAFEAIRRFFTSDQKAIACVIACPTAISDDRVVPNLNLLIDLGVSPSNINNLFRTRPSILSSGDLGSAVEEVKGYGFDPSKTLFSVALLAKRAMAKSQWDTKVDALKKWGWSEDTVVDAFRRQPSIMLRSTEKLNAVMNLWVDQLGWDTSALLAAPIIFGYSLEKRIIPRASVVKYLLSKGLMKKEASLTTPFGLTDELFLQKFVNCFEKEETSRLLRLYQGACKSLALG